MSAAFGGAVDGPATGAPKSGAIKLAALASVGGPAQLESVPVKLKKHSFMSS